MKTKIQIHDPASLYVIRHYTSRSQGHFIELTSVSSFVRTKFYEQPLNFNTYRHHKVQIFKINFIICKLCDVRFFLSIL